MVRAAPGSTRSDPLVPSTPFFRYERVRGEAIGMLYFRGEGPRRFVAALEAAMLDPAAIRQWYLSVIAALAPQIRIQAVTISGHPWCEVDYPVDVQTAKRMVASWRPAGADSLGEDRDRKSTRLNSSH